MIGASPSELSVPGLLCIVVAIVCRVAVLVISRMRLMKADARLSTWYSNIATATLFGVGSLVTLHFVPPVVPIGWLWILLLGVTTTTGVAVLFISTTRIGPFRTALTMNLEPLLATLLSALFLGEVFAPVQALGAAVMIAALFAFQLRR
nr:DMT family transporter [Rhodoplanes tepidamans]